MDKNLLFLFIILNALNVIIQTIKSIVTIKCEKFSAAVVNAIAYGLYTVVVVYMVCDLPLLWKVIIVGACNFIGVYIVKWFEEKMRKDKLWKVEVTVPHEEICPLKEACEKAGLAYNYIDIQKYGIFNIYCETQNDSLEVKKGLACFHAKYFVSEAKEL